MMKLWNVFRMELFKNINDRISLLIMLILMCFNIIGGLVFANTHWFVRMPSAFEIMVLLVFGFSVFGSFIFLFLYPYRMARTDYKNNVMSLIIASGVSRVQYYFVKTGSVLLFSFMSITQLLFLPLIIVGIVTNGFNIATEFVYITLDIGEIFSTVGIMFLNWLSLFSVLMTSVIMTKGKITTIFVYFGISIVASLLFSTIQAIIGIHPWETNHAFTTFRHVVTIGVLAFIGILVLRKQDL